MLETINHKLIGKKVLVYCTGVIVEATIKDVSISDQGKTNERFEFRYSHRPINWGGEIYTTGWKSCYVLIDKEVSGLFQHAEGSQITPKEIIEGIIRD